MKPPTFWNPAPLLRAVDERWWLRHGLFWLAWTAGFTWVFVHNHMAPTLRLAFREVVVGTPVFLVAAYALLYGVLPVLWRGDEQHGRFLLWLAGWTGLSLAFSFAYRYAVIVPMHVGEHNSFPDYHVVYSSGSFFPLLASTGVAACLHVYRRWWGKEQDNARLTQENYHVELQLLKAQIHPHFLFNTLNNLYALTLRQADEAPEMVTRLSGLLRFVVEQGDAPLVALADEVALLRNYLALQQMRFGSRLTLEFDAGAMPAGGRIAPLLLLPLVENAFKHGAAEQLGAARIRIALAVADGEFTCVITNTKNADAAPRTGPDGIGLQNVRQRLRLLYPQRHRLDVDARDDTFAVRLAVQLPAPAETAPAAPVLLGLQATGAPGLAVLETAQWAAAPARS